MNRYNTLENQIELRELTPTKGEVVAMKAKADTMMDKIIRKQYAAAVASGNTEAMAKAQQLADLQGIIL